MYLSVQAKNIADEFYHHKYYLLYKKHVRSVMKKIEYNANHGGHKARENAKNNGKTEIKVLRQIAKELSDYGYHCTVTYETLENSYSQWYLEVNWH